MGIIKLSLVTIVSLLIYPKAYSQSFDQAMSKHYDSIREVKLNRDIHILKQKELENYISKKQKEKKLLEDEKSIMETTKVALDQKKSRLDDLIKKVEKAKKEEKSSELFEYGDKKLTFVELEKVVKREQSEVLAKQNQTRLQESKLASDINLKQKEIDKFNKEKEGLVKKVDVAQKNLEASVNKSKGQYQSYQNKLTNENATKQREYIEKEALKISSAEEIIKEFASESKIKNQIADYEKSKKRDAVDEKKLADLKKQSADVGVTHIDSRVMQQSLLMDAENRRDALVEEINDAKKGLDKAKEVELKSDALIVATKKDIAEHEKSAIKDEAKIIKLKSTLKSAEQEKSKAQDQIRKINQFIGNSEKNKKELDLEVSKQAGILKTMDKIASSNIEKIPTSYPDGKKIYSTYGIDDEQSEITGNSSTTVGNVVEATPSGSSEYVPNQAPMVAPGASAGSAVDIESNTGSSQRPTIERAQVRTPVIGGPTPGNVVESRPAPVTAPSSGPAPGSEAPIGNNAEGARTSATSEITEETPPSESSTPPSEEPVVSEPEETKVSTCKDEALKKIMELFSDKDSKILVKQFELTALKAAYWQKNGVGSDVAFENAVQKKQDEFLTESAIEKAVSIYEEHGLPSEMNKISQVKNKIKNGQLNYYKRSTKLANNEASALFMIMAQDKDSLFGVEDAAITWMFDKVDKAKLAEQGSAKYNNLYSMSVHINKLMDPKIAGGTNLKADQIKKMMESRESDINKAVASKLKDLSEECKIELGLVGCDEANLSAELLKSLNEIFKDALIKVQKDQVKDYFMEIKSFLAPPTVLKKTTNDCFYRPWTCKLKLTEKEISSSFKKDCKRLSTDPKFQKKISDLKLKPPRDNKHIDEEWIIWWDNCHKVE